MTRTVLLSLTLVALGAALCGSANSAPSDADCRAAWATADLNKDGVLDANEATRFNAALRVAEKPVPTNGTLSQSTFLENCQAGFFQPTTVEAGAPFSGANSFTEGQAKDRIEAAGYTNVSGLTKDQNGIWRGTAQQAGKTVDVAVDYKGNVVRK